jgi:hypothetical protein
MPIPTPLQAKPHGAEAPVVPTPPAAPALPGPFSDIAVLEQQVANYAAQLAGLKAQRTVLQRQISNSSDGTTRAALELKKVPLDGQIAQIEMDLASAKAQLLSRASETGQPAPDLGHQQRQFDPDLAAGLMFAFIFAVLMPISIAIARRIWRGKRDATPRVAHDVVSPRLDRLEQAVDAIAIEIERVAEGQRFVTKVLVDRPQPVPRPANVPDAEKSAGLGEAKPFLAIGAGPIEPIRVAERQAVRQSITPH